MTNDSGQQNRFQIKRRRWPLLLTAVAVCVIALWVVAGYFLDAGLYKPMVTKAIAKATGLPVTIGDLNIDVFPEARVRANRIDIGEGDFHASVDSVKATVRLKDLFSLRVTIPEVRIQGVSAVVPQTLTGLSEKYHALRFASSPDSNAKGTKVSIGLIHTEGAKIYRGVGPTPVALVDIEVRDPTSPAIAVKMTSQLPSLGPSPRLTTDLTLSRSEGVKGVAGIQGTIRLDGVRLDELAEGEGAPKATLAATVTVDGKSAEDIAFAIAGQVTPEPGEPAAVEAIAGPFTAKAWWQNDKLIVNDLDWRSPGLTWTGDFTRAPDGDIACNFPVATFNEASLGPLLALLPKTEVRLRASTGAKLEAKDLLIGMTREGQLRFVKGAASFSGIGVDHRGAEALSSVRGGLELKEGVIQITRVEADGMSFTGTAKPDLGARTVAVDLSGELELTRKRLSPFLELEAVSKLGGTVTLKHIAATFAPGQGVPPDLVIEGSLAKGSAEVESAQFRDSVSGMKMDFVTRPEAIFTNGIANSKMLGAISCEGSYRFKTGTWEGALTTDVPRVVSAFLKSDDQKRKIGPIVASYGDAPFKVTCVLPQGKATAVTISLARSVEPPLQAEVQFTRGKEGLTLGAITATTRLPLTAFAHLLPPTIVTAGSMPISFSRSPQEQAFRVQADLTDCTLEAGAYVSKKKGGVCNIEVRGEAAPGNWTAQTLLIDLLGQKVQGKMANADIVFDKVDLQLESLAGLLSRGAKAYGRVTGSFATALTKLDLNLNNVGLFLTPELGLDSITGSVGLAGGQWSARDLRVKSANSDCVLNGETEPAGWRGTLTGAKLDVNAIQALADQAKAFTGKKPETKEVEPSKTTAGNLVVEIDSVFYRRARIDKLRADVQLLPAVTHVRNLKAQPYAGWVTGALDLVKANGETPPYADIDLTLDGVDARIIDGLSTKEPRNFTGALSGKIRLQVPTGDGVEPINGVTGTVRITGQNGSLGKMGLATKALAVLRATELIRLRMPSLKDEGLLYDTLACSVGMDKGVMSIEKFELLNTSLSAEAEGRIDFPRLDTDVRIRVHPLEAVTGLVEGVPILGQAVNQVTKQGGLLLVAKGSPYEPSVRFEGTGTTEAVTEEVKEATKKSGTALKDTVKKTAEDAINRLLGR
ncbi:MAG: AsmA-like C-terminal domain-containing protein [Candidatus Hydrogenedentes bacterium]|nr:AsmA-like C-terminal domain-containing protein [Candidatus Hydrogenedentota bacterium]